MFTVDFCSICMHETVVFGAGRVGGECQDCLLGRLGTEVGNASLESLRTAYQTATTRLLGASSAASPSEAITE